MRRTTAEALKAAQPVAPEKVSVTETPLTVEMLVRALEASKEYLTVPGGGSFGMDSYTDVINIEKLIKSLKEEIPHG